MTLGDSDRALEAGLRREYPEALLEKAPGALAEWTALIAGSLAEAVDLSAIPLDLRATTFQRRVWEALRAIPRGETRSYAELAASIGRPTAVARRRHRPARTTRRRSSCRATGSSGATAALGGYRWGVERKRELLEREGGRP